jgi:hypothetical protein
MRAPCYLSLYQSNTRVVLTHLARALGRPATLDDMPEAELGRWADMGFDWIWLMRVWRTGPAGQRVSRSNREWRKEFEETLLDLQEDVLGHPVRSQYRMSSAVYDWNGDELLARGL